jgi:hypothetical protein
MECIRKAAATLQVAAAFLNFVFIQLSSPSAKPISQSQKTTPSTTLGKSHHPAGNLRSFTTDHVEGVGCVRSRYGCLPLLLNEPSINPPPTYQPNQNLPRKTALEVELFEY